MISSNFIEKILFSLLEIFKIHVPDSGSSNGGGFPVIVF
jgi:hypothetical protein